MNEKLKEVLTKDFTMSFNELARLMNYSRQIQATIRDEKETANLFLLLVEEFFVSKFGLTYDEVILLQKELASVGENVVHDYQNRILYKKVVNYIESVEAN